MRRLGRWQQLLIDALREHETAIVQVVVDEHLGRRATRAERTASQRAALRLARNGGVVLTYTQAPAGIGQTRQVVARPADWPGDWLDQDDSEPDDPDPVTWLDPPSRPTAPPARFGRWQEVIMTALSRYDIVGLRAVVEGHLGRRAVRAEGTAAQRAARLLANSGQVTLAHVRVPSAKGRRSAKLLVVARADVDPSGLEVHELQAAALRLVTPADRTAQALELIVDNVRQATAHLADVDLHTVEGHAAGKAAQALAAPLVRLSQLRQSLLMRRPRG